MAIDGCTALVTGASGGLGREVARQLHQRGARLILSGRRARPLRAIAAGMEGATTVPCDLGRADERSRLAAVASEVDVLVLVAGVSALGRPGSMDLLAPVLLARATAPAMVARGHGRIVLVPAVDGRRAAPRMPLDAGTTFALRALAASLRRDMAGTGVGVTTVLPGPVVDAGPGADAGLAPPRSAGPRLVGDVARGVVRAIEGDRAEVHVASPARRATATLADMAPDLTARLLRRTGGVALPDHMAGTFPRRI